MMRKLKPSWPTVVVAMLATLTLVPAPNAVAQEKVGANFLPGDAMVAGLLSPAKTLASPTLAMFPVEVAEAWCIENIGAPLSQLDSVRVVVSTPGPDEPMFAAIFEFKQNVALSTINPQIMGDKIEVDGYDCMELDGPPGVVLHQLSPNTIVVASSKYLDRVIKAKGDQVSGPLAKYATAVSHSGNLTLLFAVEPVRPLLNGLLQSQIEQIPPPLIEFTQLPDLLDAVLFHLDLENKQSGLNLVMLAKDDDSAKQLEEIVANGLNMARAMSLAQMSGELQGEGAVPDAMRLYANRVADKMVASLTPQRDGRKLSITSPLNYGMIAPMTLMGVAMPAIQTSTFTTRQARSMNNLKQIGLAMHNHHSAYRELPDSAIRNNAGEPLLSWRVKILPFIEELPLYEQFHLDEPWDSEHNIKLLDQMPEVYRHPRIKTAAGLTVYQAPLGEGFMFRPDGPVKFRNVLDGLSNTIMVVETEAEAAVKWTQPADWEVNEDNPFLGLGLDDNAMFNVLISDGSVRTFSPDIGVQMLKALLTIAGKEAVDF